MKQRFLNIIVLIALVFSLLAVSPAHFAQAQALASDAGIKPDAYVNPDGTLNLQSGLNGSLDLSGWDVTIDSQRGPVFNKPAAGQQAPLGAPSLGTYEVLGSGGADINGAVNAAVMIGSNLYIGGGFSDVSSIPQADYVAMWDGSAWHALGNDGNGGSVVKSTVEALAVIGTTLYVGGGFSDLTQNGNQLHASSYLAQYDTVTGLWSRVSDDGGSGCATNINPCYPSLNSTVTDLYASGTLLYASGYFTNVNDGGTVLAEANHLALWNTGTSHWLALGNQGAGVGALDSNEYVYDMVVMGGNLVVGGYFQNMGGAATADAVAVWNGTSWSGLGDNGSGDGAFDSQYDYVYAVADYGGDLVVGGNFNGVNNGSTNLTDTYNLAVWNGSWAGFGTDGVNATVNGVVTDIAVSGTELVIVGGFSNVRNPDSTYVDEAHSVARYDGTQWHALGNIGYGTGSFYSPTNYNYLNYVIWAGSDIYVGGQFADLNNDGTLMEATQNIARFSSGNWFALGDIQNGSLSTSGTYAGYVSGIAISGTDVYVVGNFTNVPNQHGVNNDAADYIVRWDGTQWNAVGSDGNGKGALDGPISAIAIQGSDIYVGGQFNGFYEESGQYNFGGSYIAYWDGNQWNSLGDNGDPSCPYNYPCQGPLTNGVYTLHFMGNDLYVGGYFQDAAGIPEADNVARYDTTNGSWHALGSNGGGDGACVYYCEVHAIADDGTTVYVGGYFNNMAGISEADHVAAYNPGTDSWSALGNNGFGDGSLNGYVYALAVDNDNIYVGGSFYNVNNYGTQLNNADYIALWNTSAGNWYALGDDGFGNNSLNNGVSALVVFNHELWVSGGFDNVNDSGNVLDGADYLVKWNGTHWVAPTDNGSGDGVIGTNTNYPDGYTVVNALAIGQNVLYFGGTFSNLYNGTPYLMTSADNIAAYGIDTTGPTVVSITRASANPTSSASVDYTVTFSESVGNVDTGDFTVPQSGVVGASVIGVSSIDTVHFTVTVNTGAGAGTFGLNLADDDSIVDANNIPLGGAGTGNGNFVGEGYTRIGVPIANPPSTYDDKSNVWTYTGTWQNNNASGKAYGNSYKTSSTVGATATVYFSGIQAKLLYTRNSLMGKLDVYVDDVFVAQIKESGLTRYKSIWTSPVFADGVHKLQFVRNSGKVNVDAVQIIPAPDFVDPAAINDLSATTGAGYGQVKLQWTAVGDDGYAGTAVSYQVRYSTSIIDTLAKWNAATVVSSGVPTPSSSGATETMTVSNLGPGLTYFFAVRAVDDGSRVGDLSNSPSAVALSPAPVPAGTYEDTSTNWLYGPGWVSTSLVSASGGSAHLCLTVGSNTALVFNGSGFTLRYYTRIGNGTLDVFVDGVKVTSLNQTSPSTSIVWKTYTLALSAGTHTVQLIDKSGKVNFDNIIITP